MESLDVFWSFRSPYSYLVCPELLQLEQDYNIKINFRVIFPIAIRDPDLLFTKENASKVSYLLLDWQRRAEFLGLPAAWPSPDPIVMDFATHSIADEQPYIYRLSYLGLEAQRQGLGLAFAAQVSRLIFGGTKDWHQGSWLQEAAEKVGLNLTEMDNAILDPTSYLDEIADNHALLAKSGHWGVPTMVLKDEPFFGQDRIDTLRWRLDQLGLKKHD